MRDQKPKRDFAAFGWQSKSRAVSPRADFLRKDDFTQGGNFIHSSANKRSVATRSEDNVFPQALGALPPAQTNNNLIQSNNLTGAVGITPPQPFSWAGIGTDVNNLIAQSAQAPQLFDGPLYISYNFPGLMASIEYPYFYFNGNDGYGNSSSPVGFSWSETIFGNYSKTFWMDPRNTSASTIGTRIAEDALRQISTKGLFSSLMPNAPSGIVTAGMGGHWYLFKNTLAEFDVNLPPEYNNPFTGLFEQYNKLFSEKNPVDVDLSTNDANNVITLGVTSNLSLKLGNGNNVIISSPVMFDYVENYLQEGARFFWSGTKNYKAVTQIFYPTSTGLFQSNNIKVGNGNNLIYYDSSDKMITTGSGNNIFLPSFGSFNWAYTNLQQVADGYQNPALSPSFSTLLAPIPQPNGNYSSSQQYSLVQSFTGNPRSAPSASQIYAGVTATATNNVTNHIGGETLVAGSGDDIFYGVDPSFYDYNPTTGNGIPLNDGQRFVTLLQSQSSDPNAKNIRYYNQIYTTVSMWGGGGNNTFNLGDPTALNIDGLNYNGAYSYILGVGHDPSAASNGYLLTDADRSKLSFGDHVSGINSININLSTNVNKFTAVSQSFDLKSGKSVAGLDWAKTGIGLANGSQKFFDKVIGVTALGKKFFPFLDTGLAIAGGVVDLVKNIFGTVAADPQPLVVTDTTYSQPLASWRHAIDVTDWNPQTILNITVDAIGASQLTASQQVSARWGNTQFTISNPISSNNDTGVSIGWKNTTTQVSNSPLFQLSGLGNDKYGYNAYNFVANNNSGAYQKIDQNNLAFMGQINQNLAPLKGYTASNGFNFSNEKYTQSRIMNASGVYQFYWSDIYQSISNNSPIYGGLTAAQILNEVSNISVQFDTMSLGYYWDTEFVTDGTLSSKSTADVTQEELVNAVSVDPAKSKLWVESITGAGAVWNFFTYDQFSHTTLALADALRAKTYYSVNGEIDQNEKTSQRIASGLVSLNTYMTDLNDLKQSSVSANPKLTNLGQITHVAPTSIGLIFPTKGVDVYYMPDASKSEVYKTFITANNGVSTASDPTKLTNQEIASFINQGIDINLSENVIASLNPNANSPVTVLTGTTNVSGAADMYKLVGNDNAVLYLGSAEEEYLLTSPNGYFGKSAFHLATNGFDLGSSMSGEHDAVYQFQDPTSNDIIFSPAEHGKSSVAIPGNYINEGFAFWAQEAEDGLGGAQKMFSLLDNATGAHAYTASPDLAAQLSNSGHFTNQGAQFAV